jgi:uncharacterized membrane protein
MSTSSRVSSSGASSRWLAIDASRGIAMAFVCLSHFGTGYFAGIGQSERQIFTDRIAMLASPAFILISGSMLGMLARERSREQFDSVRERFVDRGLFLLIVAHVLIVFAHLPLHAGRYAWIRWGFITDTIAVCLLVGPALVDRLPARARLALAGAMYAGSWWIVLAWHPSGLVARFLKDTVVGPMGDSTRLSNFPILPWLALYVAGTVLGEELVARRRRSESPSAIVASLGAVALLVAAAWTIVIGAGSPPSDVYSRVADLGSPFQKVPPGPLYLLGYGGLAMLMMAAVIRAEERRIALPVLRVAALVGRASLFVFVLQYYVNFALVPMLHLPDTPWWPLFFAGSLAALHAATRVWMLFGLNRLITVGYPFARARAPIAIPAVTHLSSQRPATRATASQRRTRRQKSKALTGA